MGQQVIIMKGLPACGKTTRARRIALEKPGTKIISKDSLRKMFDDGVYNNANEEFVRSSRDVLIRLALDKGHNVIVDDTNLDPRHTEQIRRVVGDRAEIIIEDMTDVSPEECKRRDKKRPDYVGEDVIMRNYYRYLYTPPVPISFNPDLPECVVVDLDGTLALMGDRSPYDTAKCHEDTLNVAVAELIDMYRRRVVPVTVILVTGRNEEHRKMTHQWLIKYHVPFDVLYMRQDEDRRSDYIVKEEIYEQEIKGKYNVLLVLEDRTQVVKMWREKGLHCWQVALGDY